MKKKSNNDKPLNLKGDFEGIMQTIMFTAGGKAEKVIRKKRKD